MTSHQFAELIEQWEATVRNCAKHASTDEEYRVYKLFADMFETTASILKQHPAM